MIIDHCDKKISIKIVYFGPALSGKTTSIKALFSLFGKGEDIYSIESTVNRTLFFDYGTVTFQNKEWSLKIHIYTTTGQDFYFVTRPITLRAVDGIIFVIDSHHGLLLGDPVGRPSFSGSACGHGDRRTPAPNR